MFAMGDWVEEVNEVLKWKEGRESVLALSCHETTTFKLNYMVTLTRFHVASDFARSPWPGFPTTKVEVATLIDLSTLRLWAESFAQYQKLRIQSFRQKKARTWQREQIMVKNKSTK